MKASEYLRVESELIARFRSEGLTQGDAQGCAEGEIFAKFGVTQFDVASSDPQGWVAACVAAEGVKS